MATAKAINGGEAVQVRNALAGGLRATAEAWMDTVSLSRPLGGVLGRAISQIARLPARQARRRQDFIHKVTTGLAKNHG